MIKIVEASTDDFGIIREIAYQTWPVTYGQILSESQLNYMLGAFYSDIPLMESVSEKGHRFILAKEGKNTLGFASFELDYDGLKQTKIHKIYILPETQGKGIGKKLIDFVENEAKKYHSLTLCLNVNRFNTALGFYQKLGFEVVNEVIIELEHGYLMEDFIMTRQVGN